MYDYCYSFWYAIRLHSSSVINKAILRYRTEATLNLSTFYFSWFTFCQYFLNHEMLDKVFDADVINTYRALTICQALLKVL